MRGYRLDRMRRRVGYTVLGLSGTWLLWTLLPGMPVMRAPRASAEEQAVGEALFEHEWRPNDALARGDGLGPVFNGRSCAECHFQGGIGGGGDNKHNVLAFEAHPTRDNPDVRSGLVHKFAVEGRYAEKTNTLHDFFPIVPFGVKVEAGCQVLRQDFDPVRTESVNTTALFGAGWIDRIAAKSILHHNMTTSVSRIGQELSSDFSGITPGRPRILPDGRVGKFGWKAQFATLEEFVAAACANEIGLGNPKMPQAKPLVRSAYPEVAPDLDRQQFRALVAYIDTLPRPAMLLPESPRAQTRASAGEAVFRRIGCAACHTPDLGGLDGVYSDFLLHRLDDPSKSSNQYGGRETLEVPLPDQHPLPAEWKTPPLWGVADSAPYFHDGGSPTLETAIERHHGDAEPVCEKYSALAQSDRSALIFFLKTLRAPSDAKPAPSAPATNVALSR
ncbi:MAG: di-heme oxidoredictase family protein [Isosphaeraceae bacterium]|nr:di-heme oxidoredictase family protein [Isosphaeraceae bacterium]